MKKLITAGALAFGMLSCSSPKDVNLEMNRLGEDYVKTVLEIGQYDPLYIDAYYGPEEWRKLAVDRKQEKLPVDELSQRIDNLLVELESIHTEKESEVLQLRHTYLKKQLLAAKARVEMIAGKSYSFDEESSALYDAVVPKFTDEYFANIIKELEKAVPGKGNLMDRLSEFRKDFVIPTKMVDTVFKAAIEESRRRTKMHIDLPENENFVLEYVRDKAWAGYNWYKGNNFSLIQVNIDIPIRIDRAIDLASHEGYPGHHVYNCLLETHMVKERGWMEFSVYPLFSPQSLIAEGTANYGINVVFPKAERMKFEKEVLFPLAGLDVKKADLYYKIQELSHELTYARTRAMRKYLDGEWTKEQTMEWMEKYALIPANPGSFRFPETYRSYIINYNWGQDLVKNYIESRGGTEDNPQKRWEEFTHLISTPQVPSLLKQ